QPHYRVIQAGGLRAFGAGVDDQFFENDVVAGDDFHDFGVDQRLRAGAGHADDDVDIAREQRLYQRVFGGVFLIDDLIDGRRATPVVLVGLHDEVLALLIIGQDVGAGTDGGNRVIQFDNIIAIQVLPDARRQHPDIEQLGRNHIGDRLADGDFERRFVGRLRVLD